MFEGTRLILAKIAKERRQHDIFDGKRGDLADADISSLLVRTRVPERTTRGAAGDTGGGCRGLGG